MGSDMVVALSRATVDGHTFFGHNSNRPANESQSVLRRKGQLHGPEETLQLRNLALAQPRQTFTVLAGRTSGRPGYHHGVNEHGLAVARTPLRSRLSADRPGLTGPELVRLLLERAVSAREAVDQATDLITRYGQARPDGETEQDNAFLIADPAESYVLVACASCWLVQEVADWRALNEVCPLRQGWHRIAPDLAELAHQRGWQTESGLADFEQTLGLRGETDPGSLRRHRRAVRLLEQQNGSLDLGFLRRLLSDHFEGGEHEIDPWSASECAQGLCRHARGSAMATAVSLAAQLDGGAETLRTVWFAFGPPCSSVYFPLFFEGTIPAAFQGENGTEPSVWEQMSLLSQRAASERSHWLNLREALPGLQARFEQETREFQSEAKDLLRQDNRQEVAHLAETFMQHNLECFENLCRSLLQDARQTPRTAMLARSQQRLSQMTEL